MQIAPQGVVDSGQERRGRRGFESGSGLGLGVYGADVARVRGRVASTRISGREELCIVA